jgi:hypothetical protein
MTAYAKVMGWLLTAENNSADRLRQREFPHHTLYLQNLKKWRGETAIQELAG